MPGKKYLFPPLNPTTSCGNTGPSTNSRSYSAMRALIVTGTLPGSVPRESSAASGQGRSPSEVRACGLSHSWLSSETPGNRASRVVPGRLAGSIPSSDSMRLWAIGGCVPRATITSNPAAPASFSRSCTAGNRTGSGAVRVWSGTISRTRLPATSASGINCRTVVRTASTESVGGGAGAACGGTASGTSGNYQTNPRTGTGAGAGGRGEARGGSAP